MSFSSGGQFSQLDAAAHFAFWMTGGRRGHRGVYYLTNGWQWRASSQVEMGRERPCCCLEGCCRWSRGSEIGKGGEEDDPSLGKSIERGEEGCGGQVQGCWIGEWSPKERTGGAPGRVCCSKEGVGRWILEASGWHVLLWLSMLYQEEWHHPRYSQLPFWWWGCNTQ